MSLPRRYDSSVPRSRARCLRSRSRMLAQLRRSRRPGPRPPGRSCGGCRRSRVRRRPSVRRSRRRIGNDARARRTALAVLSTGEETREREQLQRLERDVPRPRARRASLELRRAPAGDRPSARKRTVSAVAASAARRPWVRSPAGAPPAAPRPAGSARTRGPPRRCGRIQGPSRRRRACGWLMVVTAQAAPSDARAIVNYKSVKGNGNAAGNM